MSKLIFVNLPVTDLKRSKAFYAAIGAANPSVSTFSQELSLSKVTTTVRRRVAG